MTKSYLVKATVNFEEYDFYARPGDVIVYHPDNDDKLVVYREGQIVSIMPHMGFGFLAMANLPDPWFQEL
jgi:uncharacterized protein YfaT (DUF1175 family)